MSRILITGSSGLIGSALTTLLKARGVAVRGFDLSANDQSRGDVCDLAQIQRDITDYDGIIHLAAISRVIWGERDPELCRATNVGGVDNVLKSAAVSKRRPWVIFASSREVYGQPDRLPASEECPLRPVNVYGRSKSEGEGLIETARRNGLRACIIRLSNVFGAIDDHADRVVPAFARAAVMGEALRVDGAGHTFDFTHVDDVARGIVTLADLLQAGEAPPPPIHFVSGQPTTLGELARMAIDIAASPSPVRLAPPRTFDVSTFYGNPSRARAILGWSPQMSLHQGLGRLIKDIRTEMEAELAPEGTP